jgi:RNA polymerase sigma factor (TIGR02999 family)
MMSDAPRVEPHGEHSGSGGAMGADTDITTLLVDWRNGDEGALNRLMPLVYEELRQVAHRQLHHERDGHTLGTTALVHEAYLRLVDQSRVELNDREHFYSVAARAMRRVLVDHARRHGAAKRGGARVLLSLDEASMAASTGERAGALLALDDALGRLAAVDERMTRVVECRFFGGLTEEETATALGVTARTVRRDWVRAKSWLYQDLSEDERA